jgi:hypothetical protein
LSPIQSSGADRAHADAQLGVGAALRDRGDQLPFAGARFFGTSEQFWINLQARYDLKAEKDRLGDALHGIRPLSAASRPSLGGSASAIDSTRGSRRVARQMI